MRYPRATPPYRDFSMWEDKIFGAIMPLDQSQVRLAKLVSSLSRTISNHVLDEANILIYLLYFFN